jgi:hypothetical protein
MDHEWTMEFVAHRVADQRILRLIGQWLKAGVAEDGEWKETKVGTPQGAVIAPLLANVYLHYVFDLGTEVWRNKGARGAMIMVRYADDVVVGFQHRADAERFLAEIQKRLAKFGLEVHPEKTRLIEFGRLAEVNRKRRGEGKPETFTFLGFTHYGGTNSKGYFVVWRRTRAEQRKEKLREIKQELRRSMHEPVPVTGQWRPGVVEGYYQYHAVPGNLVVLGLFREHVCRSWRSTLRRRSQKRRMKWNRLRLLFHKWIPRPRVLHPYPSERFDATHPR